MKNLRFATRLAISSVVLTTLAGCGVTETAAVATAQAESAAEAAKQAKEMEAKIQQDLDAAQKTAAESRAKAEEL
jgi:cell division protein FtsX